MNLRTLFFDDELGLAMQQPPQQQASPGCLHFRRLSSKLERVSLHVLLLHLQLLQQVRNQGLH